MHVVGGGDGAGYNVNIGWPAEGVGDADYMAAFFQVVLPIAAAYAPQLTIISAGMHEIDRITYSLSFFLSLSLSLSLFSSTRI